MVTVKVTVTVSVTVMVTVTVAVTMGTHRNVALNDLSDSDLAFNHECHDHGHSHV